MTFWLLPSFDNYEWSCYNHPCADFCVDINFQLFGLKGKYQGTWFLDCMVICILSMFGFLRNCQLSSKVTVSFCIPIRNDWEFLLCHILTSVWCWHCFEFGLFQQVQACLHAKLFQLCPTLCNPMDHSPPGSSVHGVQPRILSELPFHPPGDLPDSGIEPMSCTSPALAGRFFITSTTWEAQNVYYAVVLIYNFLITNNIEHLFLCLLSICISSLVGYQFTFSAHLKSQVVCLLTVEL